ncbi:hypothetical protein MNBD_GAMMA13-2132 [hydrothermal vent metagenome]|uniref:RDD domain-containing protein n=1 Tax=hydrothermal vent metagenome TaxID=652676 RepID=A0A3B0Z6M3_9ZZZZ
MEYLNIHSVDGMDVSMELAELGSRSYAYLLDWHFRLLLALSWWVAVWLILGGVEGVSFKSMVSEAGTPWHAYLLFAPPVLIYLLYHPLLEFMMGGRTPGKRMAGVRLVTAEGQTPTLAAILIRNLFRLIDSLPAFYVLGCAACVLTRQRVRIGDLAAGTVLIHENKVAAGSLEQARKIIGSDSLIPAQHALLLDIITRWKELDRQARIDIGSRFLSKVGSSPPTAKSAAKLETAVYKALQQLTTGAAK